MVQMVVDDPSWNIFGGLADAFDPVQKARAKVLGAQYAQQVMKNEQLKNMLGAIPGGIEAGLTSFDQTSPPGVVPTPPGSPVPFEGPATPEMDAVRANERKRLQSVLTAGMYSSNNPKEFVQAGYGIPAVAEVQTGGIPADKGRRDTVETMLGSLGMQMPGYDQAKMPLHPFTETDLATGQVRRGITQNGAVDVNGQPIGGPGKSVDIHQLSPANAKSVEDANYRNQLYLDTLERLRVNPNAQLSPQRLNELAMAWQTDFGSKPKINEKTGGVDYVQEKQPHIQLAPILDLILQRQQGGGAASPAPQPPPAAPPAPAPTAIAPQPDALAGAQPAAPPPAAAAAPAAAAPLPPVVPPQQTAARRPGFAYGDEGTRSAGGSPSSQETLNVASRVVQAQNARMTLQQFIGYNDQTGLPSNYYVPSAPSAISNELWGGSTVGRLATQWLDPKAKNYQNAAYAWIEPVLRNASGAAIRQEEYKDYFRMFIPETGDTRDEIVRKLDRMKLWEQVTARATTAGQALDMMQRVSQGDPVSMLAVGRLRSMAAERGTLDRPLGAAGSGAAAPGAPQQAAVPPPVLSREDYRRFADGL